MNTFQKWYLTKARQNSNENRISDVMQRGMDRSDPECLEYYLEATVKEKRKKSNTFPKEVLELCDKEALEAYDKQIDAEEEENLDDEEIATRERRRSLLEKLLESTRTSDYNLRSRTVPDGDGAGRLDAEEAMDTN